MNILISWVLLLFPVLALGQSGPDLPAGGLTTPENSTLIARGRYLALAGNCAACHTARGGAEYAGGRAIETPFGRVYASNLTPDPDTGLGNWTREDFWQAMHNGQSRDGRLLYPAFPYPSYTRITRADSDALFAYLRSLPRVKLDNRKHVLRFPYDNQFLLSAWRSLYFKPGEFVPDPARDAVWNRGAYLVQGLGHCSACHTSRDTLGGSDLKADLSGGIMPVSNWYASSLAPDAETGLGDWPTEHIVDLLKTGVSARGAVYGPMAEVVYKSLQHLTDSDLQAMAHYLKSLPPAPAPVRAYKLPDDPGSLDMIMAWGSKVYSKHCASCHGENGEGKQPAYLPLKGNRSIALLSAANPIRLVLNGGYPPGTAGNPRPYGMPPFRPVLSDDEIAAVVTYVRNTWGNRARPVTPDEVNFYRSAPIN